MKKLFLLFASFFLLLISIWSPCTCFGNVLSDWNDPRAYKPKPILFLHGFGGNGTLTWNKTAGEMMVWFLKYQPIGPYLEIMDFSNTYASVDTYSSGQDGWADEIRNKINDLLSIARYGFYTNNLNLVCHSLGGLAAREYLTNSKYPQGSVDKLVLIGTPNLGAPLAVLANRVVTVYKLGSMMNIAPSFTLLTFWIEADQFLRYLWVPKFEISEAIKDMVPDSDFLTTLNSRHVPVNANYYVVYGTTGHLFNSIFFKDYFGGDGVVSTASQLGGDYLPLEEAPFNIQAFHVDEPYLSIKGANPLLAFLDSTPPEIALTYPRTYYEDTIYGATIPVQGMVYKEYLPADSKVIISIYRESDGYQSGPQEFYLKPSDLWVPNEPLFPVAEFDEQLTIPGSGRYKVSCQIRNPAGLLSTVQESWVTMIVPNATYIIVHVHNPEGKELVDLEGVTTNDVMLFRDDMNFADGYYTRDASKTPFLVEPGNHTFKATFNGMSQEQNVTIAANETKDITFVFERTEFDLRSLLNRVYGGDSVVSYTHNFSSLGDSYRQGETYWEGNYEITYDSFSYYAIGTITGYARMKYNVDSYYSKARLSCDIIESVPSSALRGSISMFPQRWNGTAGMYEERDLIPATDKFNRWFVQAVYTGNYPSFLTLVEGEGWFTLIPGGSASKTICQFNARVPHHMLNTFMNVVVRAEAGGFNPSFATEFEESSSLSFLKMASVPYDLSGSGN